MRNSKPLAISRFWFTSANRFPSMLIIESENCCACWNRNRSPACVISSRVLLFDALKLNHGELEEILHGYLDRLDAMPIPNGRELQIPTGCGGTFGPDLKEVAALHGITSAQAIERFPCAKCRTNSHGNSECALLLTFFRAGRRTAKRGHRRQ